MTTAKLPIISLERYSTPQALAGPLYEASTKAGFFYVVDHGIPQETIDRAFELSRSYFTETSESERLEYEYDLSTGLVRLLLAVLIWSKRPLACSIASAASSD